MNTILLPNSRHSRVIRRCRCCGHAFAGATDGIVSSHRTSEGVVRYLRCPNGHLTVAIG